MTREDRNRSIQATDADEGRRPREAGARFRDTSASDRVSGAVEMMDRGDEVVGSGSGESSTSSDDHDGGILANPGSLERQREQAGAAVDVNSTDATRFADGTRDAGSRPTTEPLEWIPPPNIVPEGERSDR